MAIGPYDDVTGDNIAALRHHLVADALLQDGDILFLRECADIAMQRGRRNSGRRYNVIEDDMRPFCIKDTSTVLPGQFAKRLDCQWRGGIVTHHAVNIHYDRLAL